MLWLKCQGVVQPVQPVPFSRQSSVQKIAGIELQTGLSREYLEPAATFGLVDRSLQIQGARCNVIYYPVMIIAAGVPELLVRLRNPRTDRRRLAKIEWRPDDFPQLPGRNQMRIGWCESIGVDLKNMTEDIAVS